MESVKIEISKEKFSELVQSGSLKYNEYKLISSLEPEFNYESTDYSEEWQRLKEESSKAYKKRKEFEYYIRQIYNGKTD